MKNFFKILVLTICILMVSVFTYATDTITKTMDVPVLISSYETISGDEIKVQLNGEFLDFTDSEGNKVAPQIINSRTMVPMRKIFEVFGANVEWFPEDRSIKATTEDLEIGLQIDNEKAIIKNANGEVKEINLDSVPAIVDGRTLVPVRFIAESLNKKVGWDSENKSVIIIDTDFINEKIKNNASNLYEYLMTDMEKITTSESEVEISGKLKYEDKEYKKNNSTLNFAGNMGIKVDETLIGLDLNLSVTGSGILIDTVKEEKLNKINIKVIIDLENFVSYVLYPEAIVGEKFENKWIKYTFSEVDKQNIKDAIEAKNNEDAMNVLIEALLPSELTVESYEALNMNIDIICALFGNDNLEVSGRKSKTYTYQLKLENILELLGATEEEKEIIIENYGLEFTFSEKISNGTIGKSELIISTEIVEDVEKLKLDLEFITTLESYNEKVNIDLPKEKDIIEV